MTIVEAIAAIQTPEGFREWLQQQPPENEVGVARQARSCPVQQYLAHHTLLEPEQREWGVTTLNIYQPDYHKAEIPPWVAAFIDKVDNQFALCESVSAAAALAILDTI